MADTLLNSQKARLFASDMFGMSEAFLSLLKVLILMTQSLLWCLISHFRLFSKMKLKRISAFKVMAGLMLMLRV